MSAQFMSIQPVLPARNVSEAIQYYNVDALFAEYQDKGVFHDKTALQNTPWGTREFAFYDLNGNGLFFYRNL